MREFTNCRWQRRWAFAKIRRFVEVQVRDWNSSGSISFQSIPHVWGCKFDCPPILDYNLCSPHPSYCPESPLQVKWDQGQFCGICIPWLTCLRVSHQIVRIILLGRGWISGGFSSWRGCFLCGSEYIILHVSLGGCIFNLILGGSCTRLKWFGVYLSC